MPDSDETNPTTTTTLPTDADNGREYGEQPLAALLAEKGLTNHQVVAASTEQLTHKMLSKAYRGRFLSVKIRLKIQRAVNALTGEQHSLKDLFNY